MINAAFGIPKVMDQYGDDPYIKETKPNVGKILNLFKKPRMAMAGIALATCAAIEKDPDLGDYISAMACLTILEGVFARPLLNGRQKAGSFYIDTNQESAPTPPSSKVYTQLYKDARHGKEASGVGVFVWGGAAVVFGPDAILLAIATHSFAADFEPVVKLKMIEDGEWSVSETPPAQPEKQKAEDTAALPQPGMG